MSENNNDLEKGPRADSPNAIKGKVTLQEITIPSEEGSKIDESVINPKDEAYLILDDDIEGFSDPRKEALLIISRSVGKLYVEGERYYRGTVSIMFPNYVGTCFHSVELSMVFGSAKGQIEFNGVKNTIEPSKVTRVLQVHRGTRANDLAILKILRPLHIPSLLVLSDRPVKKGQEIFIIGFPHDDKNSDPNSEPTFKDFYGYKVLTKGKILQETEDGEFTHDCATLKGMSGAPILDAETLEVIGIHVRGKRYERNIGVPIDLLKELWRSKKRWLSHI